MNHPPSQLLSEFFSPEGRTEVSALLNESNATAASLEVLRMAECDDSSNTLAIHDTTDPPITPSEADASNKSNIFSKHIPTSNSSDPVLQNITNRIASRLATKNDLFKISEKESEQVSESDSECKSEDLDEFPAVPRVQIGPLSNIKEMPTEDSKIEQSCYSSSSSSSSDYDESIHMEDVKRDMFKTQLSDQKMLLKEGKQQVITSETKGAKLNFDFEDTPSPEALRHSEIHMAEPAPVKIQEFSADSQCTVKQVQPTQVDDRTKMVEFLVRQKIKKSLTHCMRKWQLQNVRMKAQYKIENALATVERMTSFSKTFLALNSLVSFTLRKRASICSSAFLTIKENQVLSIVRDKVLRKVVKIPQRMQLRKAFSFLQSGKIYQIQPSPALESVQAQNNDGLMRAKAVALRMLVRRKNERIFRQKFKNWKGSPSSDFESTERICQLESTVQKQQKENEELKSILKEYSTWKSKLDQIQQQMKLENEVWKQTAQRVAKENEVYKKQVTMLKQELQTKQKQLSHAQTQLSKGLTTVQEALCSNCHNSLEQSQIFKKPILESPCSPQLSARRVEELEAMEQEISRLKEMLRGKENEMKETLKAVERMQRERKMESGKEVLELKEKIKYYEQSQDELKRKVEEQMDVVLKMEEERLTLLKESEESKERTRKIVDQMEEIKQMMEKCGTQIASYASENVTLKENNANLEAQVENLKVLNEERKEAAAAREESLISPPKSDLKKKTKSMKKPTKPGAPGAWRNLKFDKLKTPAAPSALGTIAVPESDMLQHENTILTNDLISANREMQKLKIQHRQMSQKVGKIEKQKVREVDYLERS